MSLVPLTHQVGGHGLLFRILDPKKTLKIDICETGILCKPFHPQENKFYATVTEDHPQLLPYLPKYYGTIDIQLLSSSAIDHTIDFQVIKKMKQYHEKNARNGHGKNDQNDLQFTFFSIPKMGTENFTDILNDEDLKSSDENVLHSTSDESDHEDWVNVMSDSKKVIALDDVKIKCESPLLKVHSYLYHPWSLQLYNKVLRKKATHEKGSMSTSVLVSKNQPQSLSTLSDGETYTALLNDNSSSKLSLSHLPSSLEKFILLEDLTHNMAYPCIIDLKIGRRHFGMNASPSKKYKQSTKAATSTSTKLSLRLCGMQVYDSQIERYIFISKYEGRKMNGPQLQKAIALFLNTHPYRTHSTSLLIAKLNHLKQLFFEELKCFRLYASSLLLLYDAASENAPIDVRMIDFAHCYPEESYRLYLEKDEYFDSGPDMDYINGIDNLIALLMNIKL